MVSKVKYILHRKIEEEGDRVMSKQQAHSYNCDQAAHPASYRGRLRYKDMVGKGEGKESKQ